MILLSQTMDFSNPMIRPAPHIVIACSEDAQKEGLPEQANPEQYCPAIIRLSHHPGWTSFDMLIADDKHILLHGTADGNRCIWLAGTCQG